MPILSHVRLLKKKHKELSELDVSEYDDQQDRVEYMVQMMSDLEESSNNAKDRLKTIMEHLKNDVRNNLFKEYKITLSPTDMGSFMDFIDGKVETPKGVSREAGETLAFWYATSLESSLFNRLNRFIQNNDTSKDEGVQSMQMMINLEALEEDEELKQ